MKIALVTIIILFILALASHTTIGIYNDNQIASLGIGNTYIGFAIADEQGKLSATAHILTIVVPNQK